MGSTTSSTRSYEDQQEDYLRKLENEALRGAFPRGLLDEKGNELKYKLHYCLTRNDWWFTIGGVFLGGFLSWHYRAVQPIAAAAIISPGLDWMYSQSLCTEEHAAYIEHKKKLNDDQKRIVEEIKKRVRQQFAESCK